MDKIKKCVTTCCVLHNIAEEKNEACPREWASKIRNFNEQFLDIPSNKIDKHYVNSQTFITQQGKSKRHSIAQLLGSTERVRPKINKCYYFWAIFPNS